MRGTLPVLRAIAALLLVALSVFAKGEMVRISISGGDVSAPIDITAPDALARFHPGHGPGNFEIVNGHRIPRFKPQSFIVDWSSGTVKPPQGLKVHQISFTMKFPDCTRSYIVHYATDPLTNRGYVYIPGQTDPEYAGNTRLLLRGVEGNWFHAWSEWDELAHQLLTANRMR
jgi:hypothetical protein